MAAAGTFFVTVSCVIRGYHDYKEVWNPSIGEAFVCFAEEENSHDRKAVAVTCAEGYGVGHLATSWDIWPLFPFHQAWRRN